MMDKEQSQPADAGRLDPGVGRPVPERAVAVVTECEAWPECGCAPEQPSEPEPVFTPAMIEAIYAAWHGAGVDIAGGNWKRFVGMLPRA